MTSDNLPDVAETGKALRTAIAAVLFNASNYPGKASVHMLGQDIGPLTDKVALAVELFAESLSARVTQAETTGAGLIAAERARQIEIEGYTRESDAEQGDLLLRAGITYAQNTLAQLLGRETTPRGNAPLRWSWPWSNVFWKPTGDPRRDLTKAGALIAAAIDALGLAPVSGIADQKDRNDAPE